MAITSLAMRNTHLYLSMAVKMFRWSKSLQMMVQQSITLWSAAEIQGKKVDEDGNALGGAIIGLFRPDCTEFTEENALMTTTSADDGSFSFKNIPLGDWVIREISQPTGFVLSDESFPVSITEDKQVIEIEIENAFNYR